MAYKFEQLDVWQLALDYIDLVYKIAESLPKSENYNLKSQVVRAATSIALNIAEGSQGQSNAEQARFLGMAIRSLIETVACQQIIQRRGYLQDNSLLQGCMMTHSSLQESCKVSEKYYRALLIRFEKLPQSMRTKS